MRRQPAGIVIAVVSVLLLTLLVAVVEGLVAVPNASAAYLLAVVAVAAVVGTGSAIVAAVSGFLACRRVRLTGP